MLYAIIREGRGEVEENISHKDTHILYSTEGRESSERDRGKKRE